MKSSFSNTYRSLRGGVGKFTSLVLALLLVFIPSFFTSPPKVFAATAQVDLGSGANFAVMGAAAISDTTATSTITGDVGLWYNGGASITELKCSEVTGTIYDNDGAYTGNPSGTACLQTNAGTLTTAHNALKAAYIDAAGRSASPDIPTNLGGSTLTSGVYHAASGTFSITGGGTLTLDGGGNADAVFIFKMDSTLVTSSNSKVVLTGSAQSCNVFWQVGSSATLGTSTTFVGNILALTSITDDGSSTVDGRLSAGSTTDQTGAVTLHTTTVTKSTCAAGTAGGPALAASSTSSSGGSGSAPNAKVCPSFNCVTPIIIEQKRISPTSIFISWGPYAGITTFNIRYGLTNGSWQYSTNVTGFSTTLNALPSNQPIWVLVSPTDNCSIGQCGTAKLVGGPKLPNTGLAPYENNIPWQIPAGVFIGVSTLLFLIQRKHRFSSKS